MGLKVSYHLVSLSGIIYIAFTWDFSVTSVLNKVWNVSLGHRGVGPIRCIMRSLIIPQQTILKGLSKR